jgi:hypothetical protein
MTDGQRDWEIQLPEIATAYEVKVPLLGKAVDAAGGRHGDDDRRRPEILQEREAAARAESGEPEPAKATARAGAADQRGKGGARATTATRSRAEKRPARKPGDDKPPAAKASYLLTLARVKELYRTRQYELALVELAELDRQYPTTSTSCR